MQGFFRLFASLLVPFAALAAATITPQQQIVAFDGHCDVIDRSNNTSLGSAEYPGNCSGIVPGVQAGYGPYSVNWLDLSPGEFGFGVKVVTDAYSSFFTDSFGAAGWFAGISLIDAWLVVNGGSGAGYIQGGSSCVVDGIAADMTQFRHETRIFQCRRPVIQGRSSGSD